MSTSRALDILAVAAHPDDVELGCGGTLARLARTGHRTGIVDLTRGELGSRGTPETREQEAAAAERLLGLAARRNTGLPDGGLDPLDQSQRLALIRVLRELRPTVLLIPSRLARHPDHSHAAYLAEEAVFRAGLFKIDTDQEPFRPSSVFYYMEQIPFTPSFIVDVSEDHETKMHAVHAYGSQFQQNDTDDEPATFLTRPEYLEAVEIRGRHFGGMIQTRYAEPFLSMTPLVIRSDSPFPELNRD